MAQSKKQKEETLEDFLDKLDREHDRLNGNNLRSFGYNAYLPIRGSVGNEFLLSTNAEESDASDWIPEWMDKNK